MSYDTRSEFDLQELVNEYGLGGVSTARKAESGAVNENWIVRTATGTVVVRKVSKNRTLDDIRFEHSFIRALDREGFPYRLPTPLRTRAGRSVVAKNGRYIWLYPYIEGSNSRPRRNAIIPQMAHALASAHKAARCFSLRWRNANPVALEHPWLLHTLRRLQLKASHIQDEPHRFFRAHVQECIGILEAISLHTIQRAATPTHPWRPLQGEPDLFGGAPLRSHRFRPLLFGHGHT